MYSHFSSSYQLLSHFSLMLEAATGGVKKKGVLKNFTKFTRKHLCKSLFLIQLQSQACNFIKKRLQHRCFQETQMFLRTPFLQNISGQLLHQCIIECCFIRNLSRDFPLEMIISSNQIGFRQSKNLLLINQKCKYSFIKKARVLFSNERWTLM